MALGNLENLKRLVTNKSVLHGLLVDAVYYELLESFHFHEYSLVDVTDI